MNKIIIILPNTFKSKREFKDLRKDLIDNYQIENVVELSNHSFQPYVVVGTIILNFSTQKPQDHFYQFKIKNDGYTQNKRREKKEGENDFDIFWKLKDQNEKEKLKGGFKKLIIEEIKQNDYEFNPAPDFSSIWELTPEDEENLLKKKLEHVITSIKHFEESIRLNTDYLNGLYRKKKDLEEYFKNKAD